MADGSSALDLLREQREEARVHLEGIKELDPEQRPDEERVAFRARVKRVHAHRANARAILEALDSRIEAASARRQERREKTRAAENPYKAGAGGIATFDGLECVEWIAHDLFEARKTGTWTGQLVSGFRTPEHSVEICRDICGADTCPGRCAGTTSNHTKQGPGEGAADVTDFVNCEVALAATGSVLHNDLPSDLVHMSATGH